MRIAIYGAGSIGCYVGGMLAAAGQMPVLFGRPQMKQRLRDGIMLTSHDGPQRNARPGSFEFVTSPDPLSQCGHVLVCVKSGDTAAAAARLEEILKPGAKVVSLQNGIANARLLRERLVGNPVIGGMVGFNVAQIGDDRFHRGTDGEIILEDAPGALALCSALLSAGIPASVRRDFAAVQWGKLILNLNNAVNALSGLPLKQQLSDRHWRRVFALCVREANQVLRAAAIRPAKLAKAPASLIPAILELPDWLFSAIAASMLKVDDNARSSMAEDLEKGREPEVDWLNGEIVRLGESLGIATPANSAVIAAVKRLFADPAQVHLLAASMLKEMSGQG